MLQRSVPVGRTSHHVASRLTFNNTLRHFD